MNTKSNKKTFFNFILGLLIIIGLLLLNNFLFEKFIDPENYSYFKWYIREGAFISIIAGMLAFSIGTLDNEPDLVSWHALTYLACNFQMVGLFFYSLGTNLKGTNYENKNAFEIVFELIFNILFGLLLSIIIVVATIIYLIFVVPIQYFLFLFCGGISRIMLDATKRAIFYKSGGNYQVEEINKEATTRFADSQLLWKDEKPVTVTNSIGALILYILKNVLTYFHVLS